MNIKHMTDAGVLESCADFKPGKYNPNANEEYRQIAIAEAHSRGISKERIDRASELPSWA